MDLAPIALFTFNRPWHTEQTLNALMLNELANQSDLYIYCDGPKTNSTEVELQKIKEVRAVVRKKKWCKTVKIIERTNNLGLAENIISGVSEIVNQYGRIIVLEDDIKTSIGFLKYMNQSLDLYNDNEEVFHISGYMYPHDKDLPETFFYNVPLCWGWGTWSRAWKNFKQDSIQLWSDLIKYNKFKEFDKFGDDHLSLQLAFNILGKIDTWFIKWHASVFFNNGFTLFPGKSLVQNIGFDSSGEHNDSIDIFGHRKLADYVKVEKTGLIENESAVQLVAQLYSTLRNDSSKSNFKISFLNKIKNLGFIVFPGLKRIKSTSKEKLLKKTYLGHSTKIYKPARMFRVILGKYSYISENSIINNTIIGNYCSIGPNLISGWGIHPTEGVSTHPMFYSTTKQNGHSLCDEDKIYEFEPTIIGNDVFIGMNVSILDGVTIGDGAIIGAGAVVSKDIPPFAIAFGNPIKIYKYRFSEEIIEKLQKIKWWEYDKDDNLLVEQHFFEIEEFLKSMESKLDQIK